MKVHLLALSIACAGLAQATLTNASFETPPQPQGNYTQNGIDGWTTSGGSAGVWHLPANSFFEANAPDGLQIGYSNASLVAQQSTDILQEGKTTLSVMGGRRTDSFAGSFFFRLWAGGTVASGDIIGGTLLGESYFGYTAYNPSTFSLITVEYTASANDPLLGQLLTVQFAKAEGSQMDWDDVRLVTPNPVPEPFSIFVLGAGAVALSRKRKV